MPIAAYVGLPGSGKSYTAIKELIIPALKARRTVWTNIPCDTQQLQADFGTAPQAFTVEDVLADTQWFADVLPKGVLLVLDEAWQLWKSGLQSKDFPPVHQAFLTQHRHMVGADGRSTEIALVTQDLSQVANFVRQLVERTYRTVKLDFGGMSNRYRVDVYQGAATGNNPPQRQRIAQKTGSYSDKVWRYYTSHSLSETGAAGDETQSDKRFNVMRGAFPWVMGTAVCLAVLGLYGASQMWARLFGATADASTEMAQLRPVATEPVANASVQSAAAVAPVRPRRGFLDGKAITIGMNMGVFPEVYYVFRIADGQSYTDVDVFGLAQLDYVVNPINQCLVEIVSESNAAERYYVMCRSVDVERDIVSFDFAGADSGV